MNKAAGRPFFQANICGDVAAMVLPCFAGKADPSDLYCFKLGPWEATYSSRFHEVAGDWIHEPHNLMLTPAYMQAMEEGLPANLRPRYLMLSDEKGVVACLVFQVAEFRALRDIRAPQVWEGLMGKMKRFAARIGNFKLLIFGNLFVVGENGLATTSEDAGKAIFRKLKELMKLLARREQARVLIAKDFESKLNIPAGFHALDFQPAMSLEIRPEWHSFEDYLQAMGSKYRVRVRRAFKKGAEIRYVPFSLEQIEKYALELADLYHSVVRASGFSVAEAGPEYFVAMKRRLGDAFTLTACYTGDQLCGFYSTVRNGRVLEANFVGFMQEYNRSAQLYLNMLYRIVEEGIVAGMDKIAFARTALEIKSSVGAVPEPAIVYMAHVNPILNLMLPPAVRLLEPRETWVERHVFHHSAT